MLVKRCFFNVCDEEGIAFQVCLSVRLRACVCVCVCARARACVCVLRAAGSRAGPCAEVGDCAAGEGLAAAGCRMPP